MLKPDFRPYVPPRGKSKASGISSHEHAARLQTVERIKRIFLEIGKFYFKSLSRG